MFQPLWHSPCPSSGFSCFSSESSFHGKWCLNKHDLTCAHATGLLLLQDLSALCNETREFMHRPTYLHMPRIYMCTQHLHACAFRRTYARICAHTVTYMYIYCTHARTPPYFYYYMLKMMSTHRYHQYQFKILRLILLFSFPYLKLLPLTVKQSDSHYPQ
jgi:hypothetical protein